MFRKISAIVAYTIVVAAVTAFFTHTKETPPTPAQVITQLEKQFRADPDAHLAEVDAVLNATAFLDGALLEHDFRKLAEEGEKLHQENQQALNSAHAVSASIQKVQSEIGYTCEACSCTSPCDYSTRSQEQNNKKRRVLNLLFGTPLETDEECEPKNRSIPDEVDPPVFNVTYEASLVPLPPSLE